MSISAPPSPGRLVASRPDLGPGPGGESAMAALVGLLSALTVARYGTGGAQGAGGLTRGEEGAREPC